MNACMIAYIVILFVVLTPGVFVILPYHGSKYMVALTHGLIFGLVWHFTHKEVEKAVSRYS